MSHTAADDAAILKKALDALEGLFKMVEDNPAPAIKADERFVTAGVALGELRPSGK